VQASSNTVVVGPAELLSVDRVEAGAAVWFAGPSDLARSVWVEDVEVQVRAHGAPVPARVRATTAADGAATIDVELTGRPLRGVAAGQSLVVYRGTQVLGQGTVARAWRA
jgi:tRNA-specific 2-thiouridylase